MSIKLVDREDFLNRWAEQQAYNADLSSLVSAYYDMVYEYMDRLNDEEVVKHIEEVDKEFIKEEEDFE